MPEKAHTVDKSPTKRTSGHARGNYQCHPCQSSVRVVARQAATGLPIT